MSRIRASASTKADSGRPRLGQMLVTAGLVTQSQLDEALEARLHGRDGRRERLGHASVRLGFATEADVAEMLSTQMGLEFLEGDEVTPEASAKDKLPQALAKRHRMLPLRLEDDGTLVVACADPTDVIGRDDVRTATGVRRVRLVVAPASDVDLEIRRAYGFDQEAGDLIGAVSSETDEDALALALEAAAQEDGPMVKLVDRMVADAVEQGASDIHIEPGSRSTTVRYRVDGVLREAMTVPRSAMGQFAARLKLMASLDIAERRLPQDGRARFSSGGSDVDLRVSSLPSLYGETIVIRLLRKGAERLGLDEIGMEEGQLARFVGAIERPQGLVLISGPTGSGKTSTLYAALGHLTDMASNIITLEDPVEYELGGINQTQIAERIGRTFARCLRTVLRQDPDIVMVGEIRDQETAELALQASMTGHMVLSTLHTNDAPSAVVRLRELGVAPYLVAGSLTLVVAQRLARRICEHCKVDLAPTERQIIQLHLAPHELERIQFKVGVGCRRCNNTGYRGRVGLFEVLAVDSRVRELLLENATTSEVRRAARAAGMTSLREEGLARAAEGVTTLDELLRVAPRDVEGDEGSCPVCAHLVEPDFVHCPSCGVKLGLPTCPHCERVLEAGWRVCPECGIDVAREDRGGALPRALVVDDDASVRAAVTAMLTGGYEVVEAKDGPTALEMLLSERPDIVLLDVGLPEMDGYAVTKELRARPISMDVPILLMTGDDGRETELEGLRAGADDYLTKPIDPDVLLARMEALLRRTPASRTV